MAIRGFNATKETNEILDSLEIPKMHFSKTMNGIVKEWHLSKKQKDYAIEQKQVIIEDV